MTIEISGIPYNDPSTDALSYSGRVTWDLETIRSRNGQTELYIAKSSTGQRVDLTRFLKTAIYGKRLSPLLDSGVVAYLNGAFSGTTTLTVHSAQGSNFAAGDLIAVVAWFSETTGAANTAVYRKVASVTATTVVVDATIAPTTFPDGAMVLKLNGLEDAYWKTGAYLESNGLKGALESPPTPTYGTSTNQYSVAVAAGPTFQVTIYNPQYGSQATGQYKQRYYDIYVRPLGCSAIQPTWVPDAEDVAFLGTDVNVASKTTNVTTHSGGTGGVPDADTPTILSGTFVDGDVNAGTDTITDAAHGLTNGTQIKLTTTGVLPAGLALSTIYYIVSATADTFKVALTFGGAAVDITAAAGGGTHTWTNIASPGSLSINTRYYIAIVAKDASGDRHAAIPNESGVYVTTFFTGTS